jgi:2-dehydropantoate 2-reductase
MRMLMVGVGPIGGIIGGRLARAGHDIVFVDVDKEHVAAIRGSGLQVDVPDGSFNVRVRVAFPDEIEGKFEIAFIAVRSNYTPSALSTALPRLANGGLLVSLQNGFNPPMLEEKVGPARTIGVAIRMGCQKIGPGRVQTAHRGHLYVGHLHRETTSQLEALCTLLDSVIPTEISRDILDVLWSKLTHTCVCFFEALADASLKQVCEKDSNLRILVNYFAEIIAVGKAAGAQFIPLPEYNPSDFHPNHPFEERLARMAEMARSFPENRKGPFRQIQRGIVTEIDFIVGHVVGEGERLQIPTPLCRKLVRVIHELESGKRQFDPENYLELSY